VSKKVIRVPDFIRTDLTGTLDLDREKIVASDKWGLCNFTCTAVGWFLKGLMARAAPQEQNSARETGSIRNFAVGVAAAARRSTGDFRWRSVPSHGSVRVVGHNDIRQQRGPNDPKRLWVTLLPELIITMSRTD